MNKILLGKLFNSKIRIIIQVISLLIGFAACENDIEVVKAFSEKVRVPDLTTEKVETLYFDSAKLNAKLEAPVVMRFPMVKDKDKNKDPYLEFPEGIHVQFYDSLKNVKAEVISKYAIFNEVQKLWEARKDVIVISTDGKKLNTEQLFWDQNKKIIYSNKFCRVTTPNASLTGNKFTANEDFSSYELSEVQGPLKVKDE